MQLAVIEFARNVMNVEDCGSEELHPEAKNHAIIYMPEVCLCLLGYVSLVLTTF
jgi:CTP synthase